MCVYVHVGVVVSANRVHTCGMCKCVRVCFHADRE